MKRLISLMLALVLAVGVLPMAARAEDHAQAGPAGISEPEGRVLLLTNRERLKQGAEPLTTVDFLQKACDIRADELLEKFDHERPSGKMCFSVLEDVNHPSYSTLGENIAVGQGSPEGAMDSWMHSDGHRGNILNPDFRHMGVGEVFGFSQELGGECHNWVQFFYTDFDCGYDSLTLLLPEQITAGTPVDEMGIWAELTCGSCGTCYLPVMEEFCTGYDPASSAEQTVSVEIFGMKTSFVAGGAEVPPEPSVPTDPQEPEIVFEDVKPSDYFYEPVRWAVENGITEGTTDVTFSPGRTCTRSQAVAFLWREEGRPAPADSSLAFTDVPQDAYYADAVRWAVEQGITNGITDTVFAPENGCTRSQVVTFLWRLDGCPVPQNPEHSLTDLDEEEFYFDAVLWAVEHGITQGFSDSTFRPDQVCTRAEIVTFLYRYVHQA